MCGLFGIHTCPPDHAVVPPTRSAFSNTATVAPPSWAAIAAVSPAAPVPSTTTSNASIAPDHLFASCERSLRAPNDSSPATLDVPGARTVLPPED